MTGAAGWSDEADAEWAERVYRLVAEGEQDEVLWQFHDRWPGLRAPEHEKRLVARLRGNRAKEAADA